MFIDGFGIAGYRSFGEKLQKIGPLGKINLLVGQNNSGKSNILSFLTRHYKNLVLSQSSKQAQALKYERLDFHLGKNVNTLEIAIGLKIGGDWYDRILEKCDRGLSENHKSFLEIVNKLLKSLCEPPDEKIAWFYYSINANASNNEVTLRRRFLSKLRSGEGLNDEQWHGLWRVLTKQGQGNIEQHWIPETMNFLSPIQFQPPNISLIPAIRRIGEKGATTNDYDGIDLIERLAKLQNPEIHEQDRKKQFEKINRFLQEVTDNKSAQLEIPHSRDMILVHMDGKTLPLSSLGTGIHEVVILASYATILTDQIVCVEEPELHLHPLLQKKFIRYLAQNTNNQYFITTHSAHLLDTPHASIFHVRYQEGASTVEPVYNDVAKSAICFDLGYRASDLIQANCVIWVEGPSDRIYLNHWLRHLAPQFIEGVHYSIMFYGGRLLSHLSANDPEINEFISLRRLNRYIAILIDSDKASKNAKINDTKKRVEAEFNRGQGFAWITKGREIENYIPPSILETAIKEVCKNFKKTQSIAQYDHCLQFINSKGKIVKDVDKVKIAHQVATQPANLEVLDLKQRMKQLVGFIESANDL